MKKRAKFSLVLCTIGDFHEIKKFINSLRDYQSDFLELIVVDQNKESISYILDPLRRLGFTIKYFQVDFIGLSKARNFGIKYTEGEIIAFPDDDCVYEKDLLLKVYDVFKDGFSFIAVNTHDENYPKKSLVQLPKVKHIISYRKRSVVSFTLFLRSELVEVTGGFDEKMGVGSGTKYGAGEESDYIVRALSNKFVGCYFPDLYVYHPAKESLGIFDDTLKRRMYTYGGGYGFFLRKNFFRLGFFYSLKLLLGVFYRLISNLASVFERKKSVYFLIGFFNGFLKR